MSSNVIQRLEMVLRIKAEINSYINELGTEGRLISMQMEELVANIDEEARPAASEIMSKIRMMRK